MNMPNSYFETGAAVCWVLMLTVTWAGAAGSACWAAAVAVEAMQKIVAPKIATSNFLNGLKIFSCKWRSGMTINYEVRIKRLKFCIATKFYLSYPQIGALIFNVERVWGCAFVG